MLLDLKEFGLFRIHEKMKMKISKEEKLNIYKHFPSWNRTKVAMGNYANERC